MSFFVSITLFEVILLQLSLKSNEFKHCILYTNIAYIYWMSQPIIFLSGWLWALLCNRSRNASDLQLDKTRNSLKGLEWLLSFRIVGLAKIVTLQKCIILFSETNFIVAWRIIKISYIHYIHNSKEHSYLHTVTIFLSNKFPLPN
jgi:hypothetical protein